MNFVNCFENLGNLAERLRGRRRKEEEIASHNQSYIELFFAGRYRIFQGSVFLFDFVHFLEDYFEESNRGFLLVLDCHRCFMLWVDYQGKPVK